MSTEKPKEEEQQSAGCCSCCCCACCKSDTNPIPEHLRDGDITSNRSCTDCLMIPLYLLFVIGWAIILGVAADNGKPDRILLPENFRGELCGDGRLAAFDTLWVPLPNRPSYGLCTPGCPRVGMVVCNNDVEPKLGNATQYVANSFYTHTLDQFRNGLAANVKCKGSCTPAEQEESDRYVGLQIKMAEKKCFFSYYPSKSNLKRCIPSTSADAQAERNLTMESFANQSAGALTELKDALGLGSFFTLGFAELQQGWPVILISAAICMAISVIWVLLLRWILAPIVYLVVVLILGVLIALGFIFKFFADDLEENVLPGESGTDNQVVLWRVAEYVSWLLAAMYFIIMLYMLKRIRIAIAVMDEASKAFMSAPSMILIPLVTFIIFIGWVAFFVVTSIFIQTMGEPTNESIPNAVGSFFGSEAKNISELLIGSTLNATVNGSGSMNDAFNVSKWTTKSATKGLHAYNFFAVLWTGNFCMMLGFMVMAMTVCSWYFSATQLQMAKAADGASEENGGKAKAAPTGIVCKSLAATLWNHMGTVLLGSLLIAIIQFVRAIFTYISENYLKEVDQSTMAKIIVRCIQCCLWYIEQVVRIISKNAFIICAIRSTNFCSSAAEALAVIVSNAARISILTMLSTATLYLIKIFIVGGNLLIAYALLKSKALTQDKDMESGLFPLFLIGLISYAIASLFLNVYEACIDTIFICFLMDEKYFKGEFMPESLAKIVDLFKGAELARIEYEKQMDNAMKQSSSNGGSSSGEKTTEATKM